MNNYTTKKPLKQGLKPLSHIHTNQENCSKFSRCNNYKKCKCCHTIYKNKQLSKLTNHLEEIAIRKYKYKQYLVFTSLDTHRIEEYKNADMDNFINELISTKRNKSSVINEAQYIAIKEISYTKKMGYNPHYNFIYLSNKKFIQSKAYKKLASKYNIKVHIQDIYKTDRSYLTSIKKIINYSLKFDSNRMIIENQTNLTMSKRDIKKSALFCEDKYIDLHKRLYKYISEVNKHYNDKKRKALSTYKHYNKSNPHTRVMMLRSLNKKLKHYEASKAYFQKLLLHKSLKNAKLTQYTHIIHTLYIQTNSKT